MTVQKWFADLLPILFHHMSDLVLFMEVTEAQKLKILHANDRFFQVFQITDRDLKGKELQEALKEPAFRQFLQRCREALAEKQSRCYDERISLPSGEIVLHVRLLPLMDGRNKISHMLMLGTDRSELAQLQKQERLLKGILKEKEFLAAKVLENLSEGVVITDADARIIAVNPAFSRMTGYRQEEVLGQTPHILSSGRHDESFYRSMWHALTTTGRWQGEIWNRRKNGEIYLEEISITALTDPQGKVTHYVGVFKDITERKRMEERIHLHAYHDPLTGLPNRLNFFEKLNSAIEKAEKQGNAMALMFLDLDRFKRINDTLGHPVGDRLLQAVAQRLTACIGTRGVVGRLGGDEFAVLLPVIRDQEEIRQLAEQIIGELTLPIKLEDYELVITPSIGISIFPKDGRDLEHLFKNADTAMYRAKEQGGEQFVLFTSRLNEEAVERLEMENNLRKAWKQNEFCVYYQPQMDLRTGRVIAFEALIRWKHPKLGMISPNKFIPIAEENRSVLQLDEWVMKSACRQMRIWQEQRFPGVIMSVNLSMLHFQRENLVDAVSSILRETQLEPQYLEIELTESIFMHDPNKTYEILKRFKEMGIQISLDDFGTGYSSLNYLRRFPIDKIKIARTFIRDITENEDDHAIVRAMIQLAKSLNLKVVAEGVETREQVEVLKALQCDAVQGYYFSKPLPGEAFDRLPA